MLLWGMFVILPVIHDTIIGQYFSAHDQIIMLLFYVQRYTPLACCTSLCCILYSLLHFTMPFPTVALASRHGGGDPLRGSEGRAGHAGDADPHKRHHGRRFGR